VPPRKRSRRLHARHTDDARARAHTRTRTRPKCDVPLIVTRTRTRRRTRTRTRTQRSTTWRHVATCGDMFSATVSCNGGVALQHNTCTTDHASSAPAPAGTQPTRLVSSITKLARHACRHLLKGHRLAHRSVATAAVRARRIGCAGTAPLPPPANGIRFSAARTGQQFRNGFGFWTDVPPRTIIHVRMLHDKWQQPSKDPQSRHTCYGSRDRRGSRLTKQGRRGYPDAL
jgi:hypothetical protein